jgi:hypothetical protein
VFENKVLKIIFGLKRVEVSGDWRKLYDDQGHIFQFSPSIMMIIKSRRKEWTKHVTGMAKKRNACKFRAKNLKGEQT